MVGFLPCVHSEMSLEISLLVKGSLALFVGANEFLLTSVSLDVNVKSLDPAVRLGASLVGAAVLFLLHVSVHVVV